MGFLLLALPIAALAFLSYLILSQLKQSSKARSLGCQPAPFWKPWDLIGIQTLLVEMNGWKNHCLSLSFYNRQKEMSKLHGRDVRTFCVKLPPGETWVYTFDPRNLQAVLATQFQDFQQPACRIGSFEKLLGLGIFSANGKKWEHSRALLRPQFMREQIADLGLFESHVQDLFAVLDQLAGDDGWTPNFNAQPFLERFTIDTATEFLFGESVHVQRPDGKNANALFPRDEMLRFVEAFFAAEQTTAMSMIAGDLFWIPQRSQAFKEQCKIVHNFVDTYVQRRLQLTKKQDSGKYYVLDAIVNETRDPINLRSQLLQILLAGSDTISGTLGFLIASLAQYPAIFKKLRTIIIEDFGTYNQPKQITLAGLKNCSYLQWTLNEVLRVYPVVPVNFKEAARDTTLPFGGGPDGAAPVFVPKGRLVAWDLWTTHTNPAHWGPDATSFNPERWNGRKFGFDYLPFNAGPRICIGQQFALAEVAYVAVRFLQRFDAIDGSMLPTGRLPCDWKMVDKVAGGVNVSLHRTDGV